MRSSTFNFKRLVLSEMFIGIVKLLHIFELFLHKSSDTTSFFFCETNDSSIIFALV